MKISLGKKDEIFYRRYLAGEYTVSKNGNIYRYGILVITQIKGYIFLHATYKGRYIAIGAHRLIWRVFKGRIPKGYVPNHINEIKLDNRLSNLELLTLADNTSYSTNLHLERLPKGEKQGKSKFKDEQVIKLRKQYALGKISETEIIECFGSSRVTVYAMLQGKSYKHLPGAVGLRNRGKHKGTYKANKMRNRHL